MYALKWFLKTKIYIETMSLSSVFLIFNIFLLSFFSKSVETEPKEVSIK